MKLPLGLALLPLLASVSTVALAGQPLSDQQMDKVTAGFFATATAVASAVGKTFAQHTTAATALVTQTTITGTSVGGETTLVLIEAASQSASASIAH